MPEPDGPSAWGGAAVYMLGWALRFYQERPLSEDIWGVGANEAAGDRHLAVALVNVREAARRANRTLDYRG